MSLGRCLLQSTRWLQTIQLSTVTNVNRSILVSTALPIQFRNYAARKGTRERKKKKAKVKVEIQKVGFIPHNLRNRDKMLAERASKKVDDSWKQNPIDDVYPLKYYKWIVYPFAEAVKAHRETHHPEMYNKPDAELYVTIELNMQGEKKTRFVENFKRIAAVPHQFNHGDERSVIAFAKNIESQEKASKEGAQLSGGVDLIKQIQNGQVLLTDFQYIVAHPDIMPELVVLRGLMKKNFPNPKAGTLNTDIGKVVQRLLHGISYQAIKDEFEKDFGKIDAVLGTLNMDERYLEENFASLINDVYNQKPKRQGGFIMRCLLWSPPSQEKLKIGHEQYLEDKNELKEKELEDVEGERVAL
ncbi:large ribosomal subunit protein uL1 [Euwallacea fornicatus]|uniref:large ribosomal subunit protein uL1 n=1 Tax=Euwallacea fornicatus TaxID=995702 RepID=UPI00339010B1